VLARDDVRVRGDEVTPDHPAGALNAEPAGRPIDLDHAVRGRLRPGGLEHAWIRGRQPASGERELRERVEAGERLERAVRRHRAHEPREDGRLADVLAETERRLLNEDDRNEPGEGEPDARADDRASQGVGRPKSRPEGEEATRGLRNRRARRSQQCGPYDRSEKARDRNPGRAFGPEIARAPRPGKGADGEPDQ